ncbi:hypothetical protein B0920_02040 [Massilia sp. KIM]|uniref:DUF1799 domain-containing protein n=1 Tax=Massilia sp. KIM TaxID=1955422 RepID=UPI0009CB629D|nr:DUF1799 domain-containing protein [Massilia sp. KIM]OON62281.1 hypothetical protein B0920_02040 [Massilia sp. KIM]
MAEELALLGIEDEIADAPREADIDEDVYVIWADNLPIWQMFRRLQNKWNFVAMPDNELIMTGIPYPNIEGMLRTSQGVKKKDWPGIIADIEAMEDAALTGFNEAVVARRKEKQRERERQAAAARRQ